MRLVRRGGGGVSAHFVAFDLGRPTGTDTTCWPYRRHRAALGGRHHRPPAVGAVGAVPVDGADQTDRFRLQAPCDETRASARQRGRATGRRPPGRSAVVPGPPPQPCSASPDRGGTRTGRGRRRDRTPRRVFRAGGRRGGRRRRAGDRRAGRGLASGNRPGLTARGTHRAAARARAARWSRSVVLPKTASPRTTRTMLPPNRYARCQVFHCLTFTAATESHSTRPTRSLLRVAGASAVRPSPPHRVGPRGGRLVSGRPAASGPVVPHPWCTGLIRPGHCLQLPPGQAGLCFVHASERTARTVGRTAPVTTPRRGP